MKGPSTRQVTAAELAAIVATLTNAPCSVRQVRYLLEQGALGTDTRRRTRGRTRLYGRFDVALVRTAMTLSRTISPWVARVVVTYLREALRAGWEQGRPLRLVVTGIRGELQPVSLPVPSTASASVALAQMLAGVDAALERQRRREPSIWMWRKLPATVFARRVSA
jgi:hypothetical protein